MTQLDHDGFRFEFSAPDSQAASGGRSVRQLLAVATSEAAARAAASSIIDKSVEVKLIDSGSTVLAEARRYGVGDRLAIVL